MSDFEHDLSDELRHHIELEAEDLIRQGWEPEAARREAFRRFGGEERTKERVREGRRGRWLSDLARDVRYGLRSLRRAPTFTATAVLTLTVCIGVTIAVSSVVEAVVLRPLPFDEPDELVTLYKSYSASGTGRGSTSAYDLFLLGEGVESFEDLALYQTVDLTVGEAGSTEMAAILRATPGLFPMLGVEAREGRTFPPLDSDQATQQEILLTHEFWMSRYDGDPGVMGSTLRVNGSPRTVVGVLPEGFYLPMAPGARLVLPIVPTQQERTILWWHRNSYQMMGRLASGTTVAQANAEVAAVNAGAVEESPERQLLLDQGFRTVVVSARDDLIRDVRSTLFLLWAGVGLVLLLGCVNTMNLLLARSHTRLREMATRAALGASQARLTGQLLTESALIGMAGAVGGFILGAPRFGLFDGLLGLVGVEQLPRAAEVGLGAWVLAIIPFLALGLSLVVGILPVIYVLRGGRAGAAEAGSRGGTSGRSAVRLRSGLVLAQISVAFLLVASSGLMLRSFQEASGVEPGFNPEGVLTASLSLPGGRYADDEARRIFTDRLLEEVERVPGVTAATVTSLLPFTGRNSSISIRPEIYDPGPGEVIVAPFHNRAGPGYFRTMEIEILEGRGFEPSDGPDGPNVIVIDRELADRYWPAGGALGRRMVWGVTTGEPVEEENLHTIVGVVETVKQNDLTTEEAAGRGAYYFTYRQHPTGFLSLAVRAEVPTDVLVPGLRQVVTGLDPEIPVFDVRTMEARMGASLLTRRTAMVILSIFAAIALLLAGVGLYGVLSFAVAQRTREIGIRMALGGTSARVLGLVLKRGLGIVAVGLLVGFAGSWAVGNVLRSFLFQVQPGDTGVLASTVLVLALVGCAACLVPARRATRVEPNHALQEMG